jgi:hypothetical protein
MRTSPGLLTLLALSIVSLCDALQRMPPLGDEQRRRHTSDFSNKQNHPTYYDDSPPFKGPLVLVPQSSSTSEWHTRIGHYFQHHPPPTRAAAIPFSGSTTYTTQTILQTIVSYLAAQYAPIDVKEVAESIEFYLRTRSRLLGTTTTNARKESPIQHIVVLDVCAGHGLTGMLFAACHPTLSVRVVLVDLIEPPSHRILRKLLTDVCPWIAPRISYEAVSLQDYEVAQKIQDETLASNFIVIATHACGSMTDNVLELAVSLRACGIAVLPCCYTGTASNRHTVPYGVTRALGVAWAADLRRSWFLASHDYHVDFACIPSEITPLNRIILGELRTRKYDSPPTN